MKTLFYSLLVLLFAESAAFAKNATDQRLMCDYQSMFTFSDDQCPIYHDVQARGTVTGILRKVEGTCPSHQSLQGLAVALMAPSLNSMQKIFEAAKDSRSGATAGKAATIVKMAQNFYKASNQSFYNASFYGDMACDTGVLAANFLAYHNLQVDGSGRIIFSLLKGGSTINSEVKKIKKKRLPENFYSPEGFEFARHASLFLAEASNLVFKHYSYNKAVSGVLAYRALNHAYDFIREYYDQAESVLTRQMMRNAVIGTIVATQVPLQYNSRSQPLAILLTFEYILNAYLNYDAT